MVYSIDRTKISHGSFEDSKKESREAMLKTSPLERLNILEFLRAQTYGKSGIAPRLQRSFEVIYKK